MINKNLTEKEKTCWDAIWKASENGSIYALNDEVVESLKGIISKRQYPGLVSSLQKKGWIYAFGSHDEDMDDLEITCEAKEFLGIEPNGCNGRFCERCQI